jgi:hypothetical protein
MECQAAQEAAADRQTPACAAVGFPPGRRNSAVAVLLGPAPARHRSMATSGTADAPTSARGSRQALPSRV